MNDADGPGKEITSGRHAAGAIELKHLPELVEGALERDVLGVDDFENPRYEYRRLFSELWGTYLLVLVAAGAGVVGALAIGSDITLAMKVIAQPAAAAISLAASL